MNENIYENELWIESRTMRPGGLQLTDEITRELRTTDKILDLGCGEGSTVNHLVSKGFRVIGLDISTKLIEYGRERYKVVELLKGDARKIPFPDQAFTVVLCECSIMAMEEQEKVLQEIYRIMDHGGTLLISDLYVKDTKSKQDIWNIETWIGSLENAGFLVNAVCDREWELKRFIFDAIWNDRTKILNQCCDRGKIDQALGYLSLTAVKKR